MTKAALYPTAKHLRDAIIYFMKETDRLNEVRTANATPIPHVAFNLRTQTSQRDRHGVTRTSQRQRAVSHEMLIAEHWQSICFDTLKPLIQTISRLRTWRNLCAGVILMKTESR